MHFISLRVKVIILNILLLGVFGLLGATGIHAIHSVQSLGKLDVVNKLVQKTMEIDMMHDAINGDVIIITSTNVKDAEKLKSQNAALQEHATNVYQNFDSIATLDLPAEKKAIFANLAPKFKTYTAQAQLIAESTLRLEAPDDKAMQDFNVIFKDIEAAMETASEDIDSWSSATKTKGEQDAAQGEFMMKQILVVALIACLFFSFYMQFGLFIPQKRLLTIAAKQLEGNFDDAIKGTHRKDEIGALANIVQRNKDAGLEKLQVADKFERQIKHVVDIVASAATEMGATAKRLAEITQHNSSNITNLNHQLQSTTQNIQAVSYAVNELSASGQEIRKQVMLSGKINFTAVEQSQSVNELSKELASSIQAVGDVTKIVTTITNQINLLSLNATIEAARAGESGKGFAVVASEVKGLASQTAQSTNDIVQHISNIQSASETTMESLKTITGTISQIEHISSTIAAAIEEQGQATQSIAHNIEEAANSAKSISENAMNVSQSAKDTGDSAKELLDASDELARQAEMLRSEVDGFLHTMRGKAA